jgi:soluble lytic murein transglycosylase-like protein
VARLSALAAAVALIAATAATPAEADAVSDWRHLIEDAARRSGLPAAWIEQVMRAESGGRTTLGGMPIRSRKGAIGLMQLMPATWAEMRGRLGLGADPDDPRDNILAGAFYLRLMYDRFGYPGLFAAYNAGPARYAAWLSGRRPLPGETISYLASVSGKDRQRVRSDRLAPLFAVRDGAPPASPPDPLFAIRKAER